MLCGSALAAAAPASSRAVATASWVITRGFMALPSTKPKSPWRPCWRITQKSQKQADQPSARGCPMGRNAAPSRRTASARGLRCARQSGDREPRPLAGSIGPRIEPQRFALSFAFPEHVTDEQSRATGEQRHLQAFQILVTHASAERQRSRNQEHEHCQPIDPPLGWALA